MTKLRSSSPSEVRRQILSRAVSGASRPIILLSSGLDIISVSRAAERMIVTEMVEALARVTARHIMVTPNLLFRFARESSCVEPLIAGIPTAFGLCPAAILVNGDGDTMVIFLPELELLEGGKEAELVKRRILRLLLGFSDAVLYVNDSGAKRLSAAAFDKLAALERIILRAAEQPLELAEESHPINGRSLEAMLNGSLRRITAEDILEGAEKEALRLPDKVRKLLHAADVLYQREEELASISKRISSSRFLMIIFEAISLSLEYSRDSKTKLWMEENGEILDVYIMGDFSERSLPISFSVTELLLRALGAEPCVTTVNGLACVRLRISIAGDYLFYIRKKDEEGQNVDIALNAGEGVRCEGVGDAAERYLAFAFKFNVID